jgi:hypothetical protein
MEEKQDYTYSELPTMFESLRKEAVKPEEYEIRQRCIIIASELRTESGDKMSVKELLDKAKSIYEYIITGK